MGRLGLGILLVLAFGATGAGASPADDSRFEQQDLAPEYSPDGTRIAFVRLEPGTRFGARDFGLWVLRPDGRELRKVAPLQQLPVGFPNVAWTADGLLLYQGGSDIHAVRPDGTGGRVVVRGSLDESVQPVSGDGRVVFTSGRFGVRVFELATVRLDGSDRRVLLTDDRNPFSSPSFSPDGGSVAFVHAGALWTLELRTGTRRRLALVANRPALLADPPSWSPDGRWIAYVGDEGARVVSPDGARASALPGRVLDWSAEGRALVDVPGGLAVARVGEPTFGRIARTEGGGGSWAPDGASIVYADKISGCRRYGVARYRVADDSVARLTQDCRRIGTDRADQLFGTASSDVLHGLAGNDLLFGRERSDALFGGPGADRLYGNPGEDALVGGPGADFLNGHGGGDELVGGTGDDRIAGRGGDDRVVGGPGRDVLFGGEDRDELFARDGYRDVIDCGPRRDVAYVDRFDAVVACEEVSRR